MKSLKTLILGALFGALLVGCSSGGSAGTTGTTKDGNAPVSEELKKTDLPPDAQQAIANYGQNLPAGAMRPEIKDGKVVGGTNK